MSGVWVRVQCRRYEARQTWIRLHGGSGRTGDDVLEAEYQATRDQVYGGGLCHTPRDIIDPWTRRTSAPTYWELVKSKPNPLCFVNHRQASFHASAEPPRP